MMIKFYFKYDIYLKFKEINKVRGWLLLIKLVFDEVYVGLRKVEIINKKY